MVKEPLFNGVLQITLPQAAILAGAFFSSH